jgi:hypothetical protein
MRLRGEGLEEEIKVKAIVRRVEAQIGMAVEFIALSKGTRAYLLKFVERHRAPDISPITATTSST